mmetsp:Transcript_11553/g.37969  ORF Transcript_11553/g.37969 Transcript_11553/m.37969 type:complete len:206 (+) Transcript_11553:2753-3370(+)
MPVPRALSGETGFLKTMMEATMTTTLLTHFPTLWLTVETRSSTMYDTCWYAWKHTPAIKILYAVPEGSGSAASAAGAAAPPLARAMGMHKNTEMKVMMLNRSMLSSFIFMLPITFLDSTLRDVKVRLDPIAAASPAQLKLASVKLASTTPPTTGKSDSTSVKLGISPRNIALKITEKKGSIDLTVCVKETATFPRLMLVSTLPTV